MKTIPSCRPLRVLCLFLTLTLSWPAYPQSGGAGGTRPDTVVIVPIGAGADVLGEALIADLKSRLSGKASVLSADQTRALLGDDAEDRKTPERLRAVRLIEDCLEDYYGFASDGPETVRRLKNAVAYVSRAVPASRETSQLLVSAVIALSWLEYAGGDRDAATARITRLARISAIKDFPFGYYPEGFREFAKRVLQKSGPLLEGRLRVRATPADAAVYVDNIFAGNAPLSLHLPSGAYHVTVTATGRAAKTKSVKIARREARLDLKLARRQSRAFDGNWLVGNWPDADESEKAALAAELGRRSGADKAVFVELRGPGGALIPTAILYDVRTATKLATYGYGQVVRDLERSKSEVVSDLGERLSARWLEPAPRSSRAPTKSDQGGPLYRKPAFWIAAGGVIVTGVVVGLLAGSGSSGPSTGGVVVGF